MNCISAAVPLLFREMTCDAWFSAEHERSFGSLGHFVNLARRSDYCDFKSELLQWESSGLNCFQPGGEFRDQSASTEDIEGEVSVRV